MDVKKKKQVISTLAGAFDPILRNWAQKIAANVSPHSFIRSDIFQAALGSLKGLVEAVSEKVSPGTGVAIEKITDFGDFFTGALGSRDEKAKGAMVSEWMNKFFNEAGERLQKADDTQKEFEKIKLEFELRCEILKIIEESIKPKAPEKPEEKRTDFKKMMEEWRKKLIELKEKYWPKVKNEYWPKTKQKTAEADQKVANKIWQFHGWLEKKGVK